MIYQAVISGLGEHIHIPIEADDDKQAYARACTWAEQTLPRLMRKHIQTTRLKEGEQAKDDRDVLKFASEPRMGRPSRGRSVRLQVAITPALYDWLQSQAKNGQSISDVVFKLLEESRQK